MKYKLLLLDLDGTTVPSSGDGMPSSRVVEAVKAATKLVHVSIATGRGMGIVSHIAYALGITNPCVVNGGSEIADPRSQEVIYKNHLSIEKQKEIIKFCKRFHSQLFSPGGVLIKSFEQINDEVGKLYLEAVPNSEIIEVLQELEAIEDIEVHPTSSWTPGPVMDIHITNTGATKKHGVEKLLEILQVEKSEAIGIGDSPNDVPMLAAVGFKAVMGQAPQELKELADYVAPSLEQDGVADVIERFILNK